MNLIISPHWDDVILSTSPVFWEGSTVLIIFQPTKNQENWESALSPLAEQFGFRVVVAGLKPSHSPTISRWFKRQNYESLLGKFYAMVKQVETLLNSVEPNYRLVLAPYGISHFDHIVVGIASRVADLPPTMFYMDRPYWDYFHDENPPEFLRWRRDLHRTTPLLRETVAGINQAQEYGPLLDWDIIQKVIRTGEKQKNFYIPPLKNSQMMVNL